MFGDTIFYSLGGGGGGCIWNCGTHLPTKVIGILAVFINILRSLALKQCEPYVATTVGIKNNI
jgi:hypothetical protein